MATTKKPPKAPEQPKRGPGRPKGTQGSAATEGRTERVYLSITPAQKRALEDELLELKRKRLKPASFALAHFIYEKLFPTD